MDRTRVPAINLRPQSPTIAPMTEASDGSARLASSTWDMMPRESVEMPKKTRSITRNPTNVASPTSLA